MHSARLHALALRLRLGCFVTALSSAGVFQALGLEEMLTGELPSMDAVRSWPNDSSKATDAIQAGQRFLLKQGSSMYIPLGHVPLATATGSFADRAFVLVHVRTDRAGRGQADLPAQLGEVREAAPFAGVGGPDERVQCLSAETT